MKRIIVDADRLNDLTSGGTLVLDAKEKRYLFRVLRLETNDAIEVRDGQGGRYIACIRADQDLQLEERQSLPPMAGPPIHLAFVPIKGKRMDLLLEKATELGVQEFHPIYTERSVRRDSSSHVRWSRIIRAAAQQCGTGIEPILHPARDWQDWVQNNTVAQCQLIASPGASRLLHEVLPNDCPDSIAFLTGPEGGFSNDELEQMTSNHWTACQLGSLVLRAETAPLAALVILRHRFGDLG